MVPKPPTWDNSKLSPITLQAIKLTVLDSDVVNPNKLETVDELTDWLPMHLLEIYEYCEVHDIVTVNTLAEAPEHIRSVAMDMRNRTKILKLLYWRRVMKSLRQRQ